MMLMFANALKAAPSASGIIQRTDRDGLKPYMVGEMELERFRTDPVAAIQAMTFHVSKDARTVEKTENVMKPMPASIDALIDTFGDMVWLQAEKSKLEGRAGYDVVCPASGELLPLEDNALRMSCGTILRVTDLAYLEHGWVGVPTIELLFKGFENYFLPRAWNENGPWIAWAELDKRLKAFDQERERAS